MYSFTVHYKTYVEKWKADNTVNTENNACSKKNGTQQPGGNQSLRTGHNKLNGEMVSNG